MRLEPRAGVRDEPDPGEDLIRLDHDLVGAVDPLDPLRTISERHRCGVCHRSGGSKT
jgi:hypothetical protein